MKEKLYQHLLKQFLCGVTLHLWMDSTCFCVDWKKHVLGLHQPCNQPRANLASTVKFSCHATLVK